jgi:hypothetical protein
MKRTLSCLLAAAVLVLFGLASAHAIVAVSASMGDRVWLDLNGNGIQDCTNEDGDGIIGEPEKVVSPALPV